MFKFIKSLFKEEKFVQYYISRFPNNDVIFYGEDWWAEYNRGEVDVPSSVLLKVRIFTIDGQQYVVTNKSEKFFFFFKFDYGGMCAPIPDEYKIDRAKMSDKDIFKKIVELHNSVYDHSKSKIKLVDEVTALVVTDHWPEWRNGRHIERFKNCFHYVFK